MVDLIDLLRNPDVPNEVIRDRLEDEGIVVASVYVVVGDTGEYSDHRDWYVAAYLDKQLAEGLRDRLNQWCVANNCDKKSLPWKDRHNLKPPEDPDFQNDYTGTQYDVAEIPLRGQ